MIKWFNRAAEQRRERLLFAAIEQQQNPFEAVWWAGAWELFIAKGKVVKPSCAAPIEPGGIRIITDPRGIPEVTPEPAPVEPEGLPDLDHLEGETVTVIAGEDPGDEPDEDPGDELDEDPGDELDEDPGGELGEDPGDELAAAGDELGEDPGVAGAADIITEGLRVWTEENDQVLYDKFPTADIEALAGSIGRTPGAVRQRAAKLGIRRQRGKAIIMQKIATTGDRPADDPRRVDVPTVIEFIRSQDIVVQQDPNSVKQKRWLVEGRRDQALNGEELLSYANAMRQRSGHALFVLGV